MNVCNWPFAVIGNFKERPSGSVPKAAIQACSKEVHNSDTALSPGE
jgi:hypothetical protein